MLLDASTALTPAEKYDLYELLICLRLLRENGGWGHLSATFKNGTLDEISVEFTRKPRYGKSPSQKIDP